MKSTTHSLKFKYLDRGHRKNIVLLPGWATDRRIFDSLSLEYNYILPDEGFPYCFEDGLLDFIKQNGLSKVSILGWSLGGFVAADFAGKHPYIIGELILISIREKYKREDLKQIADNLKKSKEGFLYKFYKQCFHKKENITKYKEVFKTFRNSFQLSYLLDTLDYLSEASIPSQFLKTINKIKVIHGGYDEIAPIKEAIDVSEKLEAELIIIDNCGHIPFLEEDLAKYI